MKIVFVIFLLTNNPLETPSFIGQVFSTEAQCHSEGSAIYSYMHQISSAAGCLTIKDWNNIVKEARDGGMMQ